MRGAKSTTDEHIFTVAHDHTQVHASVNLDKRQLGPIFKRTYGRISGDDLYLNRTNAIASRITDPSLRHFVLPEWLPKCSSDQRPHLGGLEIPPELHAMILSHVHDIRTIISFACTHNLLAEPALKRLCNMLASESPSSVWGLGQEIGS
ncbi:hypothetical protein PENSPDRAFT_717915 [Peniophora sp. CONT]|nr:hypothetical protein PENSPDRAFT_717915 [Peniophora sp. CONT]